MKNLRPKLSLLLFCLSAAILARAVDDAPKERRVGFSLLAGFDFDLPDAGISSAAAARTLLEPQLPAGVRELDGQKVVISGYMLPLKWEKSRVTEFLLMRNMNSCCYGVPPQLPEIIVVKTAKGGVEPCMDTPLFLHGTFKIAPGVTDGYVDSLYAMDCDKVTH